MAVTKFESKTLNAYYRVRGVFIPVNFDHPILKDCFHLTRVTSGIDQIYPITFAEVAVALAAPAEMFLIHHGVHADTIPGDTDLATSKNFQNFSNFVGAVIPNNLLASTKILVTRRNCNRKSEE